MRSLKAVNWSAFKADRFCLTPDGLYDDLSRYAQQLLSSWNGDYTRRQARLQAPLEEEDVPEAAPEANQNSGSLRGEDRHGLVGGLAPRAQAWVWKLLAPCWMH